MLTGILQPTHIIILLIVALLFLGPKRLPGAGRAIGEGLTEFKKSIRVDHSDTTEASLSPVVSEDDARLKANHAGHENA